MKLTSQEELTVKSYDRIAKDWVEKHATAGWWSNEILSLKRLLPQGKILEIGSGGGRDAKELSEAGYEYVGTDISSGLLKEAKKKNPTLTFLHQNVYELDLPEDSFDGFWASAVLLHIPKSRIDEALQRLNKIIKDKGIGFISIKQGEGENIEYGDSQHGGADERFFAYYSQEEFTEILKKNKFSVTEAYIKPTEGKTTWLVFFVRNEK